MDDLELIAVAKDDLRRQWERLETAQEVIGELRAGTLGGRHVMPPQAQPKGFLLRKIGSAPPLGLAEPEPQPKAAKKARKANGKKSAALTKSGTPKRPGGSAVKPGNRQIDIVRAWIAAHPGEDITAPKIVTAHPEHQLHTGSISATLSTMLKLGEIDRPFMGVYRAEQSERAAAGTWRPAKSRKSVPEGTISNLLRDVLRKADEPLDMEGINAAMPAGLNPSSIRSQVTQWARDGRLGRSGQHGHYRYFLHE